MSGFHKDHAHTGGIKIAIPYTSMGYPFSRKVPTPEFPTVPGYLLSPTVAA